MIVISRALSIAPDAGEPLTHPVLGWQNVATSAILHTDTQEEDNPRTNLLNYSTNLIWRSLIAGEGEEEHITIDLADYLEEVDYIAVARHNFGTAGIVCSVEYIPDTAESPQDWTELVEEQLLADDGPVIFRFTPAVYASLRLRLQVSSLQIPPEAAVFYVGKLVVFEQGVQGDYTPLPFGRVANVVNGRSERGDFLGRIVVGAHTESQANFANLTPAWVRTHLEPFLEVSAETPFFFAWSPDAYPYEVGFAWLENDPQPAFNIDGYTSIQFNMTGIVE